MTPKTRLSHAYCPICDVYFQRAPQCPRCYTSIGLVGPPPGSPRVKASKTRHDHAWIAKPTNPDPNA